MKIIPILIKPITKRGEEELLEIENYKANIISNLRNMLEECIIRDRNSKHSLMGPAGKLLSKISTTKSLDWGKMMGYIANIIRINQKYISAIALNYLEQACKELKEVKVRLTKIEWLNLIEGIDDELYFQLIKTQSESKENYIKQKFQEFLTKKFGSDISLINAGLGSSFESLDVIPHPNEIDNKEIINNFWEEYKSQKEVKK